MKKSRFTESQIAAASEGVPVADQPGRTPATAHAPSLTGLRSACERLPGTRCALIMRAHWREAPGGRVSPGRAGPIS